MGKIERLLSKGARKSWRVFEPLWHFLSKIFGHRAVVVIFSVLIGLFVISLTSWAAYGRAVPVLDPHGLMAFKERDLIFLTVILSAIVVIPVFILLFIVAWRYRSSNTKAKYEPEYGGDIKLELLWWGIPFLIILILGIVTVIATHALDPFKPIDSDVPPVKIQVVSLEWKWLFIYPDDSIASVNVMNIPINTPIDLYITADSPMNTFWIPALAGQIYSMNGMTTQLHIESSDIGTYPGYSTNISGAGYSDMKFDVNVQSKRDYNKWLSKVHTSPLVLSDGYYDDNLSHPKTSEQMLFKLGDSLLFDKIVNKYMNNIDTVSAQNTEGI